MTIAVHVHVARAQAEQQGNDALAAGLANVVAFGAVGDGQADDTLAFTDAMASLPDGGVIYLPSGEYKISQSLIFDKPFTLVGNGRVASVIRPTAGHFLHFREGAARSTVERLRVTGDRQPFPEWAATTAIGVGDRRRWTIADLGTTELDGAAFPSLECDPGVHMVCVVAGITGASEPAHSLVTGDQFIDGTVTWAVENHSLIQVETVFVVFREVMVDFSTDCGVFIRGDGFNTIADGTTFYNCGISNVYGSCIKTNGSDGQLTKVLYGEMGGFERGAAVDDGGFFNSFHCCSQAVVGRWPFVCRGLVAQVKFENNYHEACDTGIWINTAAKWEGGTPGLFSGLRDSRSPGFTDDGNFLFGTQRILDSHDPPFRRDIGGTDAVEDWSRDGDGFTTRDAWVTSDADDPGGYLSLRWNALAGHAARDITAARSTQGPAKWRFPAGFFLGKDNDSPARKQVWCTSLGRAPTVADVELVRRRLWKAGDYCQNTATGASEPWGWRAIANGGWGGGRQYNGGRVWAAATGNIAIGEGVEPSVPNGKVFRLLRFEIFTGGIWVTDNRYSATLSGTEPTWPTSDGQTVNETLDVTHRIVWECWGDVGVDWDVGPLRSGTVST